MRRLYAIPSSDTGMHSRATAHLALAFAITHPGVTSAIIGPHTMEQLDDLLASADVTLTDDILDQLDEIVPP